MQKWKFLILKSMDIFHYFSRMAIFHSQKNGFLPYFHEWKFYILWIMLISHSSHKNSVWVIELELSYRHLGMTKILNFNHKKKFYKNVQKWLRKGRKTKKIKSFFKIKFRYFLLFLFFLDNFTKINVFFQTSIKSSILNRFWKF